MMTNKEFRKFMDLLMCSDPWPVENDDDNQKIMIALAEKESRVRGFDNWIVAYHQYKPA